MGSGSYSFAVYASLASDRGYATKSADAVFTNHSLSAKSDIKLSNVDARTYNTQIKPEMVDTGVRESRDSSEHPETTPIIIALDVTGSMRRTPHEMIKDNFPKLMDALMQLGIKDPQLLFMAVGDHEYDNYPIQVGQFESDTEKIINSLEEFVLEGGGGGNAGERAEWDYKTAVGVAQALAESKVSWVPSVMFGGGSSSNSAMDAVGLKMLLDITKSLDKTSK